MKKKIIAILAATICMAPASAMAADLSFGRDAQSYGQRQSLRDRILELNDNDPWVQSLLDKNGGGREDYQPNTPDCDFDGENKPGNGETEKPENKPGNGETEKPENKPGNGGVEKPENKPGNGETEKPENKPGNGEAEKPEDNETQNPGGGSSSLSQASQILSLVNAERAKNGLSPLKLDSRLTQAAQVRAKEQEQSFSHTRPNGTQFYTAIKEAGVSYKGAGENVAMGQKTAQEVMNAWMNSPGHRANILNKNFTTLGVGVYTAGSTTYWAQLFTY
ncbi:MAG: transporter [Clostridiales bacterium]|nr:transporter [Clostridiales bacterium]